MASASNELTVKETVHQLGKGLDRTKAAISATIEDGKMEAERRLRRGRYAVEDTVERTVHGIRRNPVIAMTLAFSAGMFVGVLVSRVRRRSRNAPDR